jgi:magnesium transporter
MITRYAFNKTTWLDVVSPSAEEIRALFDECAIPPEFTNDLMARTPHTETHAGGHAVKITLDFPSQNRGDEPAHEIKFIATKSHLITIRFEEIELMHRFAKEFEVLSILKGAGKRATGGHIFLALLSFLYDGLNMQLDYIATSLEEIERDMFNDNEKETLFAISQASHKLITFGQTINVHAKALRDLSVHMEHFFGARSLPAVAGITERYDHLLSRVTMLTGTLQNLRDTDNALLTAKQNEVMKMLTIMAFITFPLSLFSSLFGMNTTSLPLTGFQGDFWVIVGIMVFVSIGFFGYFKYKRWL